MRLSSNDYIKEIYGKRWEIENSYNSIKDKLKIESFSWNLPQFIYQDIYAQIVVYNQIQDILYTERKIKKSSKGNEYKINEGKAIGIFKEKYIKIMLINNPKEAMKELDKEDFNVKNIDISNMPIGLTKKDIKPEYYNFKENFVTIITAKNIEEAIQFTSNIWQEMEKIKDINTIVLDPDRKILSGRNDLKNNFEQMKANIKKKILKHNICFILGLDKFFNYLEDEANKNGDDISEGGDILQSIMQESEKQKNYSFIIVDMAGKIKEHKYDEWYNKNVLDENVIWIGNGIDDQYIIEVNASRKDIVNNCSCSFGYINKKDKTTMMKLLGMKEKREDDE